ncbi:YitT family protein [Dorea formicigenerans]|uniref:YitT family protein n=1 Tax=Dorea formicigenerans TaxID=39486 RepID=UPI00156DB883|nr:YitT family protein [Dorea formicigenerans]NSE86509.1 YitT family protein [Dorea formicigenerans]
MLDEHMGPIKKYSILTVGAVVLALANYVFKFPNHFSFGGVAGFAVILSGMFGGSASTYTFVINMLLLLIAFPILGKEVAMRSFYVSIVFSGVLEVAQYVYPIDKPITNQPVLELVFSFMLLAVCSAIFFFMDASSGGTDIIALILKKYTSVSIGMALLLVDFAVVLISFFVYNPTVGLFSFAGFLEKSFFIDSVIESLNLCKYFTIVSDNADTICDYIHKELNHSATIMSAEGSYSHEPKKVIMTVVNRDQALKLRKFVRSVEPHAFMMITNSSEIIGKGFRNTM